MRKSIMILAGLLTWSLLHVSAQNKTGNIDGHVMTTDGKPVEEANVEIKELNKNVRTTADGSFRFRHVPLGHYTLVYSYAGVGTSEVKVTVPPDTHAATVYQLPLNTKQLEEVIISYKRSMNHGFMSIGKARIPIMDLPQAVTIISQSTIENQQAQRLSDVMKNVNGLYLGSVRGSTQETFYARGYNLGSTNTFKNGFRVNSGAMPEMSAMESIEVLKGGAALLYGNVAPGGIVNMVTKKPRFDFGGEGSARWGSFDLYKPTIDIYGPITESIAYRANGTYEKANSYRDGVHSERYYFNPSVLFRVSNKTQFLLQGDYLKHKFTPDFGIGTLSSKEGVYGGKTIAPVSRSSFFGAPWQYANTTQSTASAELIHHLTDKWELSAMAGYQKYTRDYFSLERIQADINGKWRRPLGKTNTEENYITTQTNLTGRFNTGALKHKALIGIDAERFKTITYASTYTSSSFYDTISLTNPSAYTARTDRPTDWKWRTAATNPVTRFGAYIQDLISISHKFKLLAGIRWSVQQADAAKTTYFLNNDSIGYGKKQIDKAFSPRIGLLYQPTKFTSIFASYSNSFSSNTGTDVYLNTLKPSIIDQYELGIKKEFFDGLLSANLTLYQIINNNLAQIALTGADGKPNNNTSLKELTGQTTSRGVEMDLSSRPLSGWDITAGYSYNDMRYTKTGSRPGAYVQGQRLVNTPQHTANITSFYTIKNGIAKNLKIGGGIYYVGERQAGWNNTYNNDLSINDRLFTVDDFITVDASAGYTFKKFSILAKLANITHTLNYYIHENYSINPIPPRNFVITATLKF